MSQSEVLGRNGTYLETIPERGQIGCLVKMGVIPVLFEQTAGGDPSLEQAVSLPPFWNGLDLCVKRQYLPTTPLAYGNAG